MEVISREVDEDYEERCVVANDNDICGDCKNLDTCPLIICLTEGLANLTQEISVVNCCHFN